jgi:hypothetical protein
MVDRYSRWAEAVPLRDITAETVADALISNWIARYGVPVSITTDRGSNFESHLFTTLIAQLGSIKIHTTAYHPQGNALVERFHRRLKEALKASSESETTEWVQRLPLILLSLRTASREDDQPSPAEIVYGTNLRLPIDLLIRNDDRVLDPSAYTDRLIRDMQTVGPIITRDPIRQSYVDKNLQTCQRVFVRNEGIKGLNPVYSGPFKVLQRAETYFKVQLPNRVDNITIARLKAAHTEEDTLSRITDIPPTVIVPIPNARVIEPEPAIRTVPVSQYSSSVPIPQPLLQPAAVKQTPSSSSA